MITKETLEMINAELDAEMAYADGYRTVEKNFKVIAIETEGISENAINKKLDKLKKQEKPNKNHGNEQPEVRAEETEHMKEYERIMKLLSFAGMTLGIEMKFDSVPSKKIGFWVASFTIALTAFQIFNMQYIHYENRNYKRTLEPFALYGQLCANIVHLYGFVRHKQQVLSLELFFGRMCRQSSRAEILRAGFLRSLVALKLYGLSIMACALFYVTVPLNAYITEGEWSTFLPMKIVFCDESTVSGFIATTIVQGYIGCYSTVNTLFFGSLFIKMILNYTLQMKLIAEDFKDLDKMWMISKNTSLAYKRAYLRNIWMKIQDANNYLTTIKDTYEQSHFIYFCFNFFSQIVCLFEIATSSFTTGYPLSTAIFTQMMAYCIMGSQISIAVDELCFAIYDTNWYIYDLKSQKLIQCLLQQSQHIKEIRLGPIAPLNVITGIQVVKTIISYYTVMKEML